MMEQQGNPDPDLDLAGRPWTPRDVLGEGRRSLGVTSDAPDPDPDLDLTGRPIVKRKGLMESFVTDPMVQGAAHPTSLSDIVPFLMPSVGGFKGVIPEAPRRFKQAFQAAVEEPNSRLTTVPLRALGKLKDQMWSNMEGAVDRFRGGPKPPAAPQTTIRPNMAPDVAERVGGVTRAPEPPGVNVQDFNRGATSGTPRPAGIPEPVDRWAVPKPSQVDVQDWNRGAPSSAPRATGTSPVDAVDRVLAMPKARYTMHGDQWAIEGRNLVEGQPVNVMRGNGATKVHTVGKIIEDANGVQRATLADGIYPSLSPARPTQAAAPSLSIRGGASLDLAQMRRPALERFLADAGDDEALRAAILDRLSKIGPK